MIERLNFGRTGHHSSRTIFGAAALGGMSQSRAIEVLDSLSGYGVNHIDTAAGYGESELRLAPWLTHNRQDFFLATKTGERSVAGARDQLQRSLERLGVDQVDLIQLHNLVDENEWQTAMGPGGALEALIEARDEGLVRFIGITGHGTRVAQMHLRSLARFDFDSVLVPYNFTMMQQPEYAADFEALVTLCAERNVAVQTIKSIARRRWTEQDDEKRFSWYMPLRDVEPIQRAVHFVLSRPGLFLNTSSDATLLPIVLNAAEQSLEPPSEDALQADIQQLGIEPLFVRGVSDTI
ncbi:MAG: aldo/keto reductase [Pseudomonadales bacterium]|jgi:aryl-alcohol dehydrogenase-like predicted oxidoreductase